ncbi:hypothetical protein BC777_0613 [Yoonia maricola]|uniref:Uncharacterized protein n=1 Tax=Yoonia maricola TaxID=420999 RepID=A0A2M8WLG9_9RHOB|nr:hypothetical protein [Yoonia maricola]PJI91774.1 hypothetical protein BC777_0613 [Yoonia maricola]
MRLQSGSFVIFLKKTEFSRNIHKNGPTKLLYSPADAIHPGGAL